MNLYHIFVVILVPNLLEAQLTRFTNEIFQTIAYNAQHRSVIVATESIKQVLFAISLSAEGDVGEAINDAIKLQNISMEMITYEAGKLFDKRQNGNKIADLLNYIYVDESHVIAGEYVQLLRQYFNQTKAESIKFDENTRLLLNEKYAEMSDNKLSDILQADIFNTNAQALIVTALYFNASWQHTFSKGRYQTPTSPVKMMDCTADFLYAELEELDAKVIAVPYGEVNLEMLLVLPNKVVPLKELEQKLFDYDIRKIGDRMHTRNILLTMPEWTLHYKLSLKRMLTILGFGVLFQNSEYVNMFESNGSKPVTFSDYIYDVTIKFDDVGVEPQNIDPKNSINPPLHFDVNHPYIFYIKDKDTIYFAGHVVTFDDSTNGTEDQSSTTTPLPAPTNESTFISLTTTPSTSSTASTRSKNNSNCPEDNDETYSIFCGIISNMSFIANHDQNERVFSDVLQQIKEISSSAENFTVEYGRYTNTGDTPENEMRDVVHTLEQVTTSIRSMACLSTILNHQATATTLISARSGSLSRFVEIFKKYIQFTLAARENAFQTKTAMDTDVSDWNETLSILPNVEDLEFVHIKSVKSVKSKKNARQLLKEKKLCQDSRLQSKQVMNEKKTAYLNSTGKLKPTLQPTTKYELLKMPLIKLEARSKSKTKPPKKPTKPPNKATKRPKKTTKAPKKTTKATKPPKKSTKAPKKTTKATKPPKKTTKAPKKTTKATKPPKKTTKATKKTTKATKPPKKTTKATKKTTKAPTKPTKPPPKPTKAPTKPPTKAPTKPTTTTKAPTKPTTTTKAPTKPTTTIKTTKSTTTTAKPVTIQPPGIRPKISRNLLPTVLTGLLPGLFPTLPPNLLPTLPPNLLPTLPPSLLPTLPPSLLPTLPPNLLPTLPPNLLPTLPPNPLPTLPPVLYPTAPPVQPPFTYPPIVYPPIMLPPITIIQNIYPPYINPTGGPIVINTVPSPSNAIPEDPTNPSEIVDQTTSPDATNTTPNISKNNTGMMGVLEQLGSTIGSSKHLFKTLVAAKNVTTDVCNGMARILNHLSTSMSLISSLQEKFKAKSK